VWAAAAAARAERRAAAAPPPPSPRRLVVAAHRTASRDKDKRITHEGSGAALHMHVDESNVPVTVATVPVAA
jgi:hypothetical protein